MTSHYLTKEACDERVERLIERIVREHCGDGPYTFDPKSDFNRVPRSVRLEIARRLHV